MLSSKLKSSISESAFSSFSTVDSCQQAAVCKFYQEFIRQDLFQSVHITSTLVRDSGQTKSQQPYAAYVITVTTKLIDYTIEKRYSCFRQLYKRLAQRTNLQCVFPPKTLLSSSGSNQEVMSMRRQLLQRFLQELTQLPKELLVELFEFLNVRGIYLKEKIQLESIHDKEFSIKCGEQNIFELLAKLEFEPTEAINQIERIIFDGHALAVKQLGNCSLGLVIERGYCKLPLCKIAKKHKTQSGLWHQNQPIGCLALRKTVTHKCTFEYFLDVHQRFFAQHEHHNHPNHVSIFLDYYVFT